MEVSFNNKTSFGWFYGTHKRVTRLVLRDFPRLAQFRETLEECAQKPDFDELGTFSKSHFYSPSKKKGFLDHRGKDNAFVHYRDHVSKMLAAAEVKSTDLCIEHAGRAIHFLQDIAQPQHTQKVSVLSKLFGLKAHLRFEEFAKRKQAGCFVKYQYKSSTQGDFEEIFLSTAISSSKNLYPIQKNRYAWERIGRNAINDAIHATRGFVEKLNAII